MDLLVFDIDGTLTATNAVDQDCFLRAVKDTLQTGDFSTDWNHYLHVTDSGIAGDIAEQKLFREISPDELHRAEQAMLKYLWQAPAEAFAPVPGAADFLARVRQSDRHALAIATGAWGGSARLKLERAGLEADGIPLASSSDSRTRVHIMELAHERALEAANRTRFERVTYFGDGQWDLSASQCLGWNFVAIGEHHAKLREAGARHAFPDWTDVEGILAALVG